MTWLIWSVQPTHIINLAGSVLLHEILLLCLLFLSRVTILTLSGSFQEKCAVKLVDPPPEEGWIKINVNASRRHRLVSTSIGYIIRDSNARIIITNNKNLRDCLILVPECKVIRHTIIMTIKIDYLKFVFIVTLRWLLMS